MNKKQTLLGIGNIYLETNYLSIDSGGNDLLEEGKEYKSESYETKPGGSVVNFVLQAKKLGEYVGLIGKVGKDEAGKKLLHLLNNDGIATNLIIISKDVQTSVDTGVVLKHNGQNIQFVSGNANSSLSRNEINIDSDLFNEVKGIYLGGFLKQESLYKDYPDLIKNLTRKGIKIFLDHGRIPVGTSEDKKRVLRETLKLVEGYLPNEEELLGITGGSSINEALELALQIGPKFVAVKLGSNGCCVISNKENITIPAKKITAISTVGAGDSFNAGFITQYLAGKSLEECAEFANSTAAFKVSKNKFATYQEVLSFIPSQV